ncbi:diaminobutyrate--2-oxoglutarate transaminase family protein [Pseudoalteromonas sp. SCSIO 43201]|uniref:diaminobutyrate--2-oxoglutarate transaminase family protein n=1 Tax=Pseudoalteromonas TaxID=53246 RepID=UPI002074AE59|nr:MULTISPECIES: diaminobutyrate--2-oxoglutarate transaminase family protein [Pseudoalteromonas]MDW7549094.1 diaminobutyrate--2-oxoglutarate transaminase family protein [Pseudoalteromonas peptidolytica]USD31032.1 diaminobutyrate--2-oxoglutarate transaminase family protein [Pseudoalteromonas sp. SCSIO 43201]
MDRTQELTSNYTESQDTASWYTYQSYVESSARTYSRVIDKVIVSGKGSILTDADGKEYVDLLACAGTLALGHNNPEIKQELIKYLHTDEVMQGLDILTPAKYAFTKELLGLLPEKFRDEARIQFCGPSGADATEAAIKLFKTATKRRTVLAFHGGYHGMTAGALSLTGNLSAKDAVASLMPDVHYLPFPYDYRSPYLVQGDELIETSLHHIETVFSDPESGITKPAAVILEAIQGEGGCIPAPAKWLKGLRQLCDEYDIPLIFDEIQCGFARSGDLFAFQSADIMPDAILLSKALGGGMPMSVVVYREKYDHWKPGAHTGTFRGNQLAMIAGRKGMEIIRRDKLAEAAQKKGTWLKAELEKLKQKYTFIGDVRGRGLMLGVEIIHPNTARSPKHPDLGDGSLASAIKKQCFANGLILETGGRFGAVLRLLPALTISMDELERALELLDLSMSQLAQG